MKLYFLVDYPGRRPPTLGEKIFASIMTLVFVATFAFSTAAMIIWPEPRTLVAFIGTVLVGAASLVAHLYDRRRATAAAYTPEKDPCGCDTRS